jgi:hypothetical protein
MAFLFEKFCLYLILHLFVILFNPFYPERITDDPDADYYRREPDRISDKYDCLFRPDQKYQPEDYEQRPRKEKRFPIIAYLFNIIIDYADYKSILFFFLFRHMFLLIILA